jgi:hypothetical protein
MDKEQTGRINVPGIVGKAYQKHNGKVIASRIVPSMTFPISDPHTSTTESNEEFSCCRASLVHNAIATL